MALPDWLQPEQEQPKNARGRTELPWWVENQKTIEAVQQSTAHKLRLWQQQSEADAFPTSVKDLQPQRPVEDYLAVLPEYQSVILSTDKADFLPGSGSIGHKVHLNSAPENVHAVSRYLKTNRYAHKYLSGGEPADGKIFTVYFGSMAKAKEWVGRLATDLQALLLRPLSKDEVEYAPNISGRFVGTPKEFAQYPAVGARGYTPIQQLVENDFWTPRTPAELADHLKIVFERSYQRLSQLYGAFFHG